MPNRIKNQAIPLYTPEETKFNEKTSLCEWHEDYSPIVTCEDTSSIVIENPTFLEDVGPDKDFTFVIAGASEYTVNSNVVTDLSETFQTKGVKAGMYLMLYTGGVNGLTAFSGKIVSVDSETQVTLDTTLNQTAGDYFEISNWNYLGDIRTTNAYAEFDDAVPTTITSYLQADIIDETPYKVEFTITFIDPVAPAAYILVELGVGNNVLQILADDIEAKTYTAYGVADGTTLRVSVDGNAALNIDSFQIDELYQTTFEIVQCEDDVVDYNSTLADVLFSPFTNQMLLSIDWSVVGNGYCVLGCYYLNVNQNYPAINDAERIDDSSLATGTPWTFSGGWSLSGGGGHADVVSDEGYMEQTTLLNNFRKGLSYTVSVLMNWASGGAYFELISKGTVILTSPTYSSSATHEFDTGVLSDEIDQIKFYSTGGSVNFEIYSVSAFMNAVEEWSYSTDCFNLTDDTSCTVKLSGTNLDNAFGIDFLGTNYSPFIRVAGELMPAKFGGEKTNEQDSQGINKTLYFKSDQKNNLFLYQLPMFHHNFIRLLLGYDSFFIDDVKHLAEDGVYEPSFERVLGKVPDLGNSDTMVILEEDLNENKFC
jgi:hypothetical protein